MREMIMGGGYRTRPLSLLGYYHQLRAQKMELPQSLFFSSTDFTDVSFYQLDINFEVMKSQGNVGTVIRAGQNTWVDRKFETNWLNSKKAGLPRGMYWLTDSRSNIKRQADTFSSMWMHSPGELMVVADYEESYGGAWGGWKHFYDFLEQLQYRGIPKDKIWIYSNFYYWVARSPQTKPASLKYFGDYPLWIAAYPKNPEKDAAKIRIPKPWTDKTVKAWQWGTPAWGKRMGTGSHEIDMNKLLVNFQEEFKLPA